MIEYDKNKLKADTISNLLMLRTLVQVKDYPNGTTLTRVVLKHIQDHEDTLDIISALENAGQIVRPGSHAF